MNTSAHGRFFGIANAQLDCVAGGVRISQLQHFAARSFDSGVGADTLSGPTSGVIDLDGSLDGVVSTSGPRADFVIVGGASAGAPNAIGGMGVNGAPGATSATGTSVGGAHIEGAPGVGAVVGGVGGVSGAGALENGVGGIGGVGTVDATGGAGTNVSADIIPTSADGVSVQGIPGIGTGTANGGVGGFSGWGPGFGSGPHGYGTGSHGFWRTPMAPMQVPGDLNPYAQSVVTTSPATRLETGLAADVSLAVDWTGGALGRGGVPGGALGVSGVPGGALSAAPPPPPRDSGGFLGDLFGGLFDDPLLLDLDSNGVKLTSVEDGVLFDINGDGQQELVAWTQSGDRAEAWLVRDDSHDGGQAGIQSGRELFGDQHGDPNGFARLGTYDSNSDGVFDAKDAAFDQMQLWRDANHNGVSEEGEMVKLADEGIVSINVTPVTSTDSALAYGNRAIYGSFTREVPLNR